MSWSFRCLKCGNGYTIEAQSPKCPKCRSKKARWTPAGFAIRAVASGVDRDVRRLTNDFNLSNYRSAQRDEAVKRVVEAPRGVALRPAGGAYGSVSVPVDQNGMMGTPNLPYNGAVCTPTGVGTSFRPVGAVNRQAAAAGRARLQNMTEIVATHRPNK